MEEVEVVGEVREVEEKGRWRWWRWWGRWRLTGYSLLFICFGLEVLFAGTVRKILPLKSEAQPTPQ